MEINISKNVALFLTQKLFFSHFHCNLLCPKLISYNLFLNTYGILVTSLLLWEDTMTKATFESKHLIESLHVVSEN